MADLLSFPFGGRWSGEAGVSGEASPGGLLSDNLRPAGGGDQRHLPEVVAAYCDNAAGLVEHGLRLDFASRAESAEACVWRAEVNSFLSALSREPVNVRMATPLALLVISLHSLLDMLDDGEATTKRLDDIGETRGASLTADLLAEAGAVNADLKSRLKPVAAPETRTPCATPMNPPAHGGARAERLDVEATKIGDLDVCSARFHFANGCGFMRDGLWHLGRSVVALGRSILSLPVRALTSRVDQLAAIPPLDPSHGLPLRPRRQPGDGEGRVSHVREGVMRKDGGVFLAPPTDDPKGIA